MTQDSLFPHALNLAKLPAAVSDDPDNYARLLVACLIGLKGHEHPVLRDTLTTRAIDLIQQRHIPLKVGKTLERYLGDQAGEYKPDCAVPVLVKQHGWELVNCEMGAGVPKGHLQLMTVHELVAARERVKKEKEQGGDVPQEETNEAFD